MTEASDPSPRSVTLSFDLARLPSVATAFGTALISTAIVLSASFARQRGDLDGSTFLMGLLATTGLLAVAAGSHLLVADAERRASLVSWPGSAGTLGAGLMLAVYVDTDPWSAYGAGAVILTVSVLAYAGTKAAPFVLSAILGLALLYTQGFGDVIDTETEDGTSVVVVGAGLLFFVGAVTALGWLLPKTRVLSAVVVGAGAIAIVASLFYFISVFAAFSTAFSEVPASDTYYSGSYEQLQGQHLDEPYDPTADDYPRTPYAVADSESDGDDPYRQDLQVLLAYSATLALFWTLCALATGHVAFRILSVTILVLSIPASLVALAVNHPTWWQVALTAGGGLLLALTGLRLLRTDVPAPSPSDR